MSGEKCNCGNCIGACAWCACGGMVELGPCWGVTNRLEAMVDGVPNATCCGVAFLADWPLVGGGVCICEVSKDMAPPC